MIALQISPKIESCMELSRGVCGIFQLLQGSHLNNFLLKTLELS